MTLLSFAAFRRLPEEIGDELRGDRETKRVSWRA
jgi:hypothetical protein